MYPVILANTKISTDYVQKSPKTIGEPPPNEDVI